MKTLFSTLFLFACANCVAQLEKVLHPSTLEIFYCNADFRKKDQPSFSGLGFAYTRGFQKYFDWTASVNFVYAYSIRKAQDPDLSKSFLLQTDFSFRYRPVQPQSRIQPYISAGFGVALHRSLISAYANPGVGLELSFIDNIYLVVRAQKRFGLNQNIVDHNYYSLGLAGNIGKKSLSRPKQKPDMPLPNKIEDRDLDGIPDNDDACLDIKGLPQFQGCPDTDNDGISDKHDSCPTVPGLVRYQGCPIPDRDGDRINDEVDKCIDIPGVPKYFGCPVPDTDHDGINDDEDSCITEAGIKELNGCPPIKKEINAAVLVAAKNIFFKSGSFILLPASFSALDTVANILKADPKLTLRIEGHTDSVGSEAFNQSLSQNRAAAILKYLVSKGIDKSRLSSFGYGETRPVATNESEEGRATNRRVELMLSANLKKN